MKKLLCLLLLVFAPMMASASSSWSIVVREAPGQTRFWYGCIISAYEFDYGNTEPFQGFMSANCLAAEGEPESDSFVVKRKTPAFILKITNNGFPFQYSHCIAVRRKLNYSGDENDDGQIVIDCTSPSTRK